MFRLSFRHRATIIQSVYVSPRDVYCFSFVYHEFFFHIFSLPVLQWDDPFGFQAMGMTTALPTPCVVPVLGLILL